MPGKHYDLDTDVTLSGNDDKVIASQKATKTYVDTEVDKKADPTIIKDSESEVQVKELVINKLTNEEYDVVIKENNQLYLTPDTTDQDIANAIDEHNTNNAAHSTLFNAKQDKLATQTAYTSKGTASKVPQITTNTLGQVTNITEVDIAHQSIKTLKTDNTATQSTSSSETITGSGTINLHKISKTGSYNDLLNKPDINDATLNVQVEGVSKGTFSANAFTDSTINITKNDFVKTKTYTGLIGTANNQANATFYFMTVRGTTWNSEWSVRYRVDASLDEGLTPTNYQYYHGTFECYISGRQGIYTAYANFNSHSSTSYRTIYYQINHKTTEAGYNAGYGTKLGIDLTNANSNLDVNYKRTIKITLLDCNNCTVTFNENPELPPNTSRTDYDKLNSTYYTTSDSNSAGNWTRLNSQDTGLQESGDANTTYGYLVNTISTGATKIDANGYGARYSLVFATTPLNVIDERWSSLVNSSGNGTSKTALTGLTFYIDRHPQYVYSANIAAGAASANALYQDFNATDARYICNTNNTYVTTNQKCFLYLKDFNPSDMSFKSDATIGNVFTLNKLETRFPSSTEGDIYIYFLGWTTGTWYNIIPAFTQVHRIFKYTPSTGDMVEFLCDEFSKKQNKLDTQTSYTSKGSATKVPQITTNTLGQVTNITEVDITHQSIKTLKTDNTTGQTASSSETIAGSGTINLHKIAKTGTFSDLLSKPTSLSGYGITDAYTKTEVDGMISSVYKPAGSVAFASLPTLSDNVLGNVYNVTDAFTTTANFVEGVGKSYPAGTNVVVVNTGTTASPTYKFDVLAGFVDLSGYVPTSRKVNGKALSADITISKSDVGLGNVDNTSDSDKPISTATQTALDGKENTISDLNKIRSGANSFYVKGTQTASTSSFTGVLSAVDELYEGLTIDYWLPFAGTTAGDTLNLTLADGSTTGPINCYYQGTTRLTTHLSANNVGRFIYQTVTISGTSYTGWWLLRAYYTEGSNTYDREYDNYYRAYAGSALAAYGIVMKGVNGRLYPLTTPSYNTAATKTVTTVGLRPDLIWLYNGNATCNAGAVIKAQSLYRSMPSTAGTYYFNTAVPTYCDIYLCGNYDENTGLFYLATTDSSGTASVTDFYKYVPYNTEPNYQDYFITGRYYIFLGSSYSTANYFHLMNQHPMYYFDGTNLINAADKPKYAATFIDWSE